MSATDELRRLLDERGVEYGSGFGGDTLWTGRDGIEWRWDKQEDTLAMYSHSITPAQAIAATLGSGTCHLKPWEMERDTGFYDSMECDCGYVADVADWASWHFCPSCGRKNVGVDE